MSKRRANPAMILLGLGALVWIASRAKAATAASGASDGGGVSEGGGGGSAGGAGAAFASAALFPVTPRPSPAFLPDNCRDADGRPIPCSDAKVIPPAQAFPTPAQAVDEALRGVPGPGASSVMADLARRALTVAGEPAAPRVRRSQLRVRVATNTPRRVEYVAVGSPESFVVAPEIVPAVATITSPIDLGGGSAGGGAAIYKD